MPKSYYVPVKVDPRDIMMGRFPEYQSGLYPYFQIEEYAKNYLKSQPAADVPLDPQGYGPLGAYHVNMPKVDVVFEVRVSDAKAADLNDKMKALNQNSFAGEFHPVEETLNPTQIVAKEYIIHADLLHDAISSYFHYIPAEQNDEYIAWTNEDVRADITRRAYALQRLQNGVLRTLGVSLSELSFDGKREAIQEAYSADGFTYKNPKGMDMASRAWQKVAQFLSSTISADAAIKISDLHATFNKNLEQQPQDISQKEAIQNAITATIRAEQEIAIDFRIKNVLPFVERFVNQAEEEFNAATPPKDELGEEDHNDVGDSE